MTGRTVGALACAGGIIATIYTCARERRVTSLIDTVHLAAEDSVLVRDSLQIILRLPSEVQSGRPVEFAVALRNQARGPIEIRYGAPPQFFIKAGGDLRIWDSFDGTTFGASRSVRRLRPGESVEFNQTWSGLKNERPVPPGHYNVWVRLPTYTRDGTMMIGPRPLIVT